MTRLAFLALLCAALATPALAQRGGRTATLSPTSQAFAQQAQTLRDLQFSINALAARFDALEQQQTTLAGRIAALERAPGGASKEELAAVRSDLAALKTSQEKMRGEIVEDLTGKIAAISKREADARAAAAKAAAAAQKSGYNHTVEAGQTLSAIADAYKVPVRTIMKANKISDPSKLRVGQKLFIPDP